MDLKRNSLRKEMQAQYREREIIGGVYYIENVSINKILLLSTTELAGDRNRFEFSKKTGSCINMKLQSDWAQYGSEKFVFVILEELKKGASQTDMEFKEDIAMLKDLWLDKLSEKAFY